MYCNDHGTITENYPDAYLNIYPVSSESIPMLHYYPNGVFLLISTIGCNFACDGCISEFQTTRPGNLHEVLTSRSPDEILIIAKENGCIGITFCLNEPTVSLPSFLRVAQAAKQAGLLVGCSSNGYMTSETLDLMIPCLDFVNIGLKGSSDGRYRECGVKSANPVFRNVKALHDAGVFVEISAMYLAGREDEIIRAAERICAISPEIPFQVMRFVGTHEELTHLEPAKEEGEAVCRQIQQILDHVYLFNTPATDYLDSRCPVCGAIMVHRVFFGPMAARILSGNQNGVCRCGYLFPYRGVFSPVPEELPQVLGGYRSIMGANYISAVFRTLGVTDDSEIDRLCNIVISDGFLRFLQEQKDSVDTFLKMIRHLAHLSGREKNGESILEYVNSVLTEVEDRVSGLRKPRVIGVFCHPLSPLYAEKFGNTQIEMAGGISLNKQEGFRESLNTEYTVDAFNQLDPEVILISAHFAPSIGDFVKICKDLGIICQAISDLKVYVLDSTYGSGPLGWIIGLLDTANLLHPEVCRYSLEEERKRIDNLILGSHS
jgi:pyruvate-formate lyase-activating enzyme